MKDGRYGPYGKLVEQCENVWVAIRQDNVKMGGVSWSYAKHLIGKSPRRKKLGGAMMRA